MRNSIIHPEFLRDHTAEADDLVPAGSPARMRILGAVFLLCSVITLVRIWWVQTQLPQKYLEALEATTTERELIPARDGRILAGGEVLAADIEEYTIEIHYRWLEEPANPQWIRKQVRQKLSREERRNAELLEKTEAGILHARRVQRLEIEALCAVSSDELEQKLRRVQDRVQRIADSVNQRHLAKATVDQEHDGLSPVMQMAHQIRAALTTPPQREASERIVVREEESWHELFDGVPFNVAAFIAEHPEKFPGLRIRTRTRRQYPQQQLAAHVVGARTPLRDEERDGSTGLPERIGRFGVEKNYDEWLRGRAGVREIVRNRQQEIISDKIIVAPESGRDVSLTVDPGLQRLCEELLAEALGEKPRHLLKRSTHRPVTSDKTAELDGRLGSESEKSQSPEENQEDEEDDAEPQIMPRGGSVVVMEASTGRILAAASGPAFDLSLFTESTAEQWAAAEQDLRRPFLTRFTSVPLPPGSTFKTVSAIAAIEAAGVNPDEAFDCQGYLRTPDALRCLVYRHYGHGHGLVSMRNAMAQSCNVYFFAAAERTGIVPLLDWSERLGFGQKTGIDLPYEKPGSILPKTSEDLRENSSLAKQFEREVTGLSIGQSRLTVTPVQMARLMALIANGGWLVTPHVATEEGNAHLAGETRWNYPVPQRTRVDGLHDSTLAVIREGLVAAIEYPAGTGHKTARLPGLVYGGKTGTAETGAGRSDHAWFAGFAPADSPEYVFVVTLENGGSGSQAAAPVGREIVRFLLSNEGDQRLSSR